MKRWSMLAVVVTTFCQSPPAALAGSLYWNDAGGIHRRDVNGGSIDNLAFTFQCGGLAVDDANGRLAWTEVLPTVPIGGSGEIRLAKPDGSGVQPIVRQLIAPLGIAADPTHGLFWTDSGDANNPAMILHAAWDGANVKTLFSSRELWVTSGIALDQQHGTIYFTYSDSRLDSLYNGAIGRIDLDGSGLDLVVGGLGYPQGVALDVAGGKLYWTDAPRLGPSGGPGKIQRADLDGRNVEDLATGLDLPYGIALDLPQGQVYWTDRGKGTIQRVSLSGIGNAAADVLTGLTSPTGLALASDTLTPGDANGDGRVDRRDLAMLAKGFGMRAGAMPADGDFNGDHRVSWADVAILQAHFGPGIHPATAGAMVVPEPSTLALAMVAGMAACLGRVRRAKRDRCA